MYLTNRPLSKLSTLLSRSPRRAPATVKDLRTPARKKVMDISHSHLLLQFSMNNDVAELFNPPPGLTTCLILDRLQSREERKRREGRDSCPLLVKQGPTRIHMTIPEGFYLSNPWHQRREKIVDGRRQVYTMFRLSINRDDGRNGTRPEALAFLQELLQFRWATRGYVNNVRHDSQFFYSLNFEDVELSTPLNSTSLSEQSPSRNLYLMPSAKVISTVVAPAHV